MNIQIMNNIQETEIAILGILMDSPMHGYQIYKQITSLSDIGVIWKIKIANLYAILKKLESAGFVRSEVIQENNRPAKNRYELTEEGRKLFLHWISNPVKRGRDFRIVFLMKLYFAYQKGEKHVKYLIARQKEACKSWLIKWQLEISSNHEQDGFKPFIIQFRKTQVCAYLEWLEWCENHINSMENK